MTRLNTSYDTAMAQAFSQNKLEQALKQAFVSGDLQNMQFGVNPIGGCTAVFVSGMNPDENTIPPFVHPFLVKNIKGKDYLVTDIRAFKATTQLYPSQNDFEAAVKNKSEYALVKNRAILELRWIAGESAKLRSQLSFAGSVFGSWISQALTKVYALDLHDQLRVTAIALYYYHSLFTEGSKLDDAEVEVAVIHTIKVTKLPAKEVYEIFSKIPELHSVNDLCTAIKEGLENIRLRDFNLLMLMTVLKNSWYGNNAKELIAVAVEYPPAWISIVYAAMTEKTYRSSPIYKLIEIQAKRSENVETFRNNFADLIDSVVSATESIDNELVFKGF